MLVLPSFVPEEITETAAELAQAAESALADMLHLNQYISRGGVEPGSREGRDLVWQLDQKKAAFLPLAGKLKALVPDKYSEICSEFEWLILSPYASERPPIDPRTRVITDTFCADRSYGRDERPRRAVESEPPYSYFDFGPKLP
ncbi:MAG: hypothetical protein WA700_13545 [Acidobacteriaceae bacterium]